MADDISAESNILTRICDEARAAVAAQRKLRTIKALKSEIRALTGPPRGFGHALKTAASNGHYGLIAEIKKASPSGGLIREDFDPAALAKAYQEGGATCLSVLTEPRHFQGSAEHLKAARGEVTLPVLRKDFIIDPWQVYESRAMGADCILLIMSALTDAEARELEETAIDLDLDVLVEVHDCDELVRALALQSSLIGINNRNLKTLRTDLRNTEELAPLIPPDRLRIAESGIRNADDLLRLSKVSVDCYLVGESLMRQENVTAATRLLLSDRMCPSVRCPKRGTVSARLADTDAH
jgi:indole-3-glycerol phosphate synthase